MFEFLSKIDLFGAEEKLQIDSQNPKQKSEFGGIMTIILYGISFAYFLSEFIDWTQNNKLPKITTIKSFIEVGEAIKLSGRFLQIEYDRKSDPFDKEGMILLPEVKLCLEQEVKCQYFLMQYESIDIEKGIFQNVFFLEQDQIIGSPNNNNSESIYYQIQFFECPTSQFSQNNKQFKCAEQEKIDEYVYDQDNSIKITFFTTDFDTKSKQLYKIQKSEIKTVSPYIEQLYLLSLQINNLQVDDGILFNQYKKFSYISDYKTETQRLFIEKDSNIQKPTSTLKIEFRLDQIKLVTFLEYSKISEILADTGAIISWILQISFIVSKHNEKLCSDKTINEIIKMYFPDFINLKIKRNVFGRIINAQIKDKQYDPIKIDKLMKSITNIAHSKVSFINLQYEISKQNIIKFRLQFILTKRLGITYMKNCTNPETKIENYLDTFDYRIKTNQPLQDSIINISQQQNNCSNQPDNNQLENTESQQLENIIGLLYSKPEQQLLSSNNEQKIQNDIDLSIIPKECLKQEDLSGFNSAN